MQILLVLSVSGTLLARDLRRYHSEQSANQKLADQVRQTRDADTSDPDAGLSDRRFETYARLHRENPDLTVWLYIEDTRIDYPVMYTPEDPEYYLHRAFDGSYAKSGSLFIDGSCLADSNHIMIHGHHMKDKIYTSDTNAVYGDKILTLSTCSYHTEDGRFVIVAVRHG